MFFHVSEVVDQSRTHDFSFKLSDKDRELIKVNLQRWATATIPEYIFSPIRRERWDKMRNAIFGVASLLMHIQLDNTLVESLYQKYQQFCTMGIPAIPILIGLFRSPAAPENDILTELRKRLSSGSQNFVFDTAETIKFWVHSMGHCEITPPPKDIIREIGVIIATRRAIALSPALSVAAWVFKHGTSVDQQELRQLCLEGLTYLIEELDYNRKQSDDMDVPLLRWHCVSLAQAMQERGIKENIVENWLTAARTDPLPEVRLKVSDTHSRLGNDN